MWLVCLFFWFMEVYILVIIRWVFCIVLVGWCCSVIWCVNVFISFVGGLKFFGQYIISWKLNCLVVLIQLVYILLLLLIQVMVLLVMLFWCLMKVCMLVSNWQGWNWLVRVLIIGICEWVVKVFMVLWLKVWIIIVFIICDSIRVEFFIGLLCFSWVLCGDRKMLVLLNCVIVILKDIRVWVEDFLKIMFRVLLCRGLWNCLVCSMVFSFMVCCIRYFSFLGVRFIRVRK